MGGVVDLRTALETRLNAITSPLATQWENVAYTPIVGTPYQAVNLILGQPNNPEMGSFYQEQGYMQITLRYPVNNGPGAAETRAQAIRDWFPRGLTLSANGLSVLINRTPKIGGSYLDGDRYSLPIQIYFSANNPS